VLDVVELGHEAVDRRPPHACSSFSCSSATSVRISKMEIMGRKRMKSRKSVRNRPIVPTNSATSQRVGQYMSHDDGRKSRWRLVTTITKRSSHMPTLMDIATANSAGTVVRTRWNQSDCGMTTFVSSSSQYMGAYGPVKRFQIMNCSYGLPLYQAMKASI